MNFVAAAVETFNIANVPLFGTYSWIALAVLVVILFIWISFWVWDDDVPAAIGGSILIGVFGFLLGVMMPSDMGQSREIDRLKAEQLVNLGYDNVVYDRGDFTASDSNGQYVRGIVEWDEGKGHYQVMLFEK